MAQLRGSYCILFWDTSEVVILADPANVYGLFASESGSILSSSLQAVLVYKRNSPQIDRFALMEQLITGFITPPTTPYVGVVMVDRLLRSKVQWTGIRFGGPDPKPESSPWDGRTRGECLSLQLDTLRTHFRAMATLGVEEGVSIGLSGGYDSRLVLALLLDARLTPEAHTWSSSGHSQESEIARQLAECANAPLNGVVVRLWDELTEEQLRANVSDVLNYWDGRSNNTQGTFNDVHTRRARVTALGGARLGLSGHGGELYRNREHLPWWRFSRRGWLRYFVVNPIGIRSLGSRAVQSDFEDYLLNKYQRILGSWRGWSMGRHDARRWYARVWLPFAAGPKLCAENQLSFSLIAFAEEAVIREALRCSPFIGLNGAFEAQMIERLNSTLAAVASNYGHAFNDTPLSVVVHSALESAFPHNARVGAGNLWRSLKHKSSGPVSRRRVSLQGCKWDTLAALRSLDLPLKWGSLCSSKVHLDRALYLEAFLRTVLVPAN
jgi:asparagine synthase (glutamine-hydrolysing)